MKRNTIQFTLFLMMILALAVSSCKDGDDGNGIGGGPGDPGGPGGPGDPGGQDENYMPREIGNTWTYSDGDMVEITDSEDNGSDKYYTITNFGPISGISLSIAEDLTVNTIKMAKIDGDYNITATLDVIPIPTYDGSANPISYTILKDDVVEGTTWEGSLDYIYNYVPTLPLIPAINTPPISVPYTFTIVEKDMTLEVAGTTYTNVIHVNQEFDNVVGGLVSTDIYYAEGVGVIRYGSTGDVDLESYELN